MKRCLIIDDSSVVRRVAAHILGSLGCTTSESETGTDGANLCTVLMPDIVLLDWHIPNESALDTIAAIRAIESERRPYIVYVTTEHDALDIARALAAGADDYLMKPFDRQSLVEKYEFMVATNQAETLFASHMV